jgi:4-hydroxy-4-methyl-2-oxoglutarate aldolase
MDAALRELIELTTTCAVCDVLMKRDLRLFMRQRIRQLGTLKVAGPALTIERPAIARAPRVNAKPNRLLMETIESAAAGTVLVMATDSELEAALWGGLLAAAAAARDLGGVVCDGPVRDPDEIVEVGCPAFATGAVPAGAAGILTLGAIGEPLLCGGIPVHSGDLVFGDGNGVVVIPQGIEREVLEAAVEVERGDQEAMQRIRAGAGLLETMRALNRA